MENLPDEERELTSDEKRKLRESILPALASIKHFDFEMVWKAPRPVQYVALNLIEVYEGRSELSSQSPFIRWQVKRIKGDPEAVTVIQGAEKVFEEWKKGASFRMGARRKHALAKLWFSLGGPRDIHRDELWKMFERKHPELLQGVNDERKVKSRTFKDAALDFLEASKGGRSGK